MLELKVGNDCGNAEEKMKINGETLRQPNVYCKVQSLPNLDEVNTDYALKNIFDNMIVTIESLAINKGVPTTYYVGNYAMKSGEYLSNMEVGAVNSKLSSEIPAIMSLALISAYGIHKEFSGKKIGDTVDINVNMTTALPVNQYTKENGKRYAGKFIGEHIVTVYLGTKKVKVNLNFEFVNVLPEGVPTSYYLQENLIKEFKNYNFSDKKILHVSIGEGTTEYPMTTDGTRFDPQFIAGDTNGVGKAIEKIIDDFIEKIHLSKYSRQDFMNVVRNKKHKFHVIAAELLKQPLENQADLIARKIKKQLEKANFDVDYVLVYGGGSILMKEHLVMTLKEYLEERGIELLYVPEKNAVTIEADGLYTFVTSPLFEKLKEYNKKNKE